MAKYDDKTILIEIPAYMDEQLVPTVESALAQADNPKRVHFAICYQSDDMTDYEILMKKDNMSIIILSPDKAKGVCYARHLCQTLLKNEDYVLHIDAHMRFVKHWDTEMIKQLEGLKDEKAVISVYPASITKEQLCLPVDDAFFDNPSAGLVHCCKGYTNNTKALKYIARAFEKNDMLPKRNVWIAGGFLFARRNFDVEVPSDPHMYHLQDEQSIALRAFTHGFNIYNMEQLFLYHWFSRPNRKMPSLINSNEEHRRLCKLYRLENNEHDLTGYDIGTVRTIEEFEKLSGAYFGEHKVLKHAQTGFYYEENMVTKLNDMSNQMRDAYNDFNETYSGKINIFIVGSNADEISNCINSANDNAHNPELLNLTIICPKSLDSALSLNAKKILVEEETKYGGYLNAVNFSEYNTSDFAMVIDSGIRFAKCSNGLCWDEYYKRKLLEAGENAVLGSYTPQSNSSTSIACKRNRQHFIVGRKGTTFLYGEEKEVVDDSITHLLRDDFLFCKTEVLQKIRVDPNLIFTEHTATYSARLFTHGIDIYYPKYSYVYRMETHDFLNELGKNTGNFGVVGHIFNKNSTKSLSIPSNYEYGIGSKRRIAMWLNIQNYDYSKNTYIRKPDKI